MTAHAKGAPRLTALTLTTLMDPAGFGEIWCRSSWLSDELELRRDHDTMTRLLKAVSSATSAADMQPLLQMTMDLFKLHAAIVCQVLGTGPLHSSIEHVLVLVEQIEDTDPENPLYIAQAADLRMQLELLMILEDDCYAQLGRRSSAAGMDPELLQARQQLLRDAEALIKAEAIGRPATQRLS